MKTNRQIVKEIMERSAYGHLAEVFVMNAIGQAAKEASKLTPNDIEPSLVHAESWIGVANEIRKKLEDSQINKRRGGKIGMKANYITLINDIQKKFECKFYDYSEWGDAYFKGDWLVHFETPMDLEKEAFIRNHPLITPAKFHDFVFKDGVGALNFVGSRISVKAQIPGQDWQ
jgi:hypothetical protein